MNRSTIKRAYKLARQPMGVYGIRNSRDDKVFVGCSANLPARINRHRTELKFGTHRNRELQKMWNSYGESTFDFEILEELDHRENAQANPEEELPILTLIWVEKLEKTGCPVVNLNC